MSKNDQPIEVFMPPNVLKAKVGGSGGLDANAIKRAEQAMEELKSEFTQWIVDDVTKLAAARIAYESSHTRASLNALYRAAHDLKGQGTTFDFPLISRVAASLCKLTDEWPEKRRLPMNLIDAHVDAIKVIVRDSIKDPADALTNVLAQELEAKVAAYLEKSAAA